MPVTPLAAAALIALCFALPFGVAALFDDGEEPRPVAVARPAVEVLGDEGQPAVRISTLDRAPRLPALRRPADEPAASAAPAATATTPAADTPASSFTPAPAPAPAPSSGSSGGSSGGGGGSSGGSSGGSFDSGGSDGGGSSDSFDSTG